MTTNAQQPYSLVHYDESVLPQTSIGNIQQDKYGYLWTNTQYGIVRFDGKEFKTFTTDNVKGLTSNRLRLCAADKNKNVYFVDENNTILKVVSPNSLRVITPDELYKTFRLSVFSSFTCNDILFIRMPDRTTYRQFMSSIGSNLQREILKCYAVGTDEGYFFYTDTADKKRMCYYIGGRYRVQPIEDSFRSGNTFILHNRVFYQTSASAATIFQEGRKQQGIHVAGLPSYLNRFFKNESEVLVSNETGTFLYIEGQLYQYQLHGDTINATLLFKNLPCSGINNIMIERTTGDIFISTKSAGIYRVKKNQFGVVNFNNNKEKGVAATSIATTNIVYALSFWNHNSIFSNGYTTSLFDSGATTAITPVANPALFNVHFLYQLDSTHLLLEYSNRLLNLDTRKSTIKVLAKVSQSITALPFAGGTTFFLTNHNISRIAGDSLQNIATNDSITFSAVEKVSENCIVLGTTSGLYYFFIAERKWQMVSHSEELSVRHIFRDKSGRLWVTTYGQGLYFLSGNFLLSIPLDNAGYLSIAHSVAEDNSGNFWIPTNHGLFKIQYASLLSLIHHQSNKLYYTYFDKTDGFAQMNSTVAVCQLTSGAKKAGNCFFLRWMGL